MTNATRTRATPGAGGQGAFSLSCGRRACRDSKGQTDLRERGSARGNPSFGRGCRGAKCPDRNSNRRTVGQGFHKGQARPLGQWSTERNAPCRKGDATGESGAVSPLAKRVGDAGVDMRSVSGAVLQTHGLPLTKNRLYVVGIWGCNLPVIARYASTDLTLERRS
jgi:hypothetical protein